jgi:hypothetical protein
VKNGATIRTKAQPEQADSTSVMTAYVSDAADHDETGSAGGKMVPAANLHPPGPAGVYEDDNNA